MRLTDKYRPKTFDEVIGQDQVVNSLRAMIEKDHKLPPCLLFSGPSGVGKTTLARICASAVGCLKDNIIEINAAEKTGIDDMREIIDLLSFIPFGASKARVVIMDEAHMLSKSAWNSLLKPTEEPAEGSTWVFCSTDPTKIPDAIKTRCTPFEIKGVSPTTIKSLLEKIAEEEGFTVSKQIIQLIAIKADKSPRRALKYLEMLHNEPSLQKAQELLKSEEAEDIPAVVALSKLLMAKKTFSEALQVIRGIDEDLEAVRLGVIKWFSTVCIRSKTPVEYTDALRIIHAFSKPWYPPEKLGPLLLAVGSLLIED